MTHYFEFEREPDHNLNHDHVMRCDVSMTAAEFEKVRALIASDEFGAELLKGAFAARDGDWFRQVSANRELANAIVPLLASAEDQIVVLEAIAARLAIGLERTLVAMRSHPDFDGISQAWRE